MIRRRHVMFVAWAVLMAAPLAFHVEGQTPILTPDALFFTFNPGGNVPGAQFINVTSNATEQIVFTAGVANNSPWLSVEPSGGSTPQSLRITVSPTGLAPGTYTDSVTIQAATGVRSTTVTLFVTQGGSGLVATPSTLIFQAQVGELPPPTQLILVSSVSSAPTNFTVSFFGGGTWLTVQPGAATTPATVEVTVNHTLLAAGTYTAIINIGDQTGTIVQSVQLTLTVTGDSPLIATPNTLAFTAELGSSVPQSRNVLVSTATGQAIEFLASAATFSGGNWLTVTPFQGTTNSFIAVTANAANVGVGNHGGVIRLTALGGTTTIAVTLTVTSGPLLTVSPGDLNFTAGNGVTPPPRTVFVDSVSGEPIPFTVATAGGDWLSVTPATATTFATLRVSVNLQELGNGEFQGVISVLAQGSTVPRTINVTLTITNQANLIAQPAQVNLTAQEGETVPVEGTIAVSSTFGVLNINAGVPPVPWLSILSISATTPGSVVISADPTGLAVGTHNASVVVSAQGAANSPLTIPVRLTITRAGPVIASVLHGASLRPGVLAVGTAASIFGKSLGPEVGLGLEIGPDGKVTKNLGGVQVFFDEIPAVLTYVQRHQVNCIVPYGLSGRTLVGVAVEYEGRRSDLVQVQLFAASPGIFTIDSSGFGAGATLNQDGSLNSPDSGAERGSFVSVFATGAGLTDPPGMDGEIIGDSPPHPILPVKAWVGPEQAEVSFAGGAPGQVSGVLQVNIKIPQNLEPGSHGLVIQVGDLVSQLGVTIVVK